MLAGLDMPAPVEAERVMAVVLPDLRSGERRGVVFDSPPKAVKSILVLRAAVDLAAAGEPIIIIAQTNEQLDDPIGRLTQKGSAAAHRPALDDRLRPSERVKGRETRRQGCGPQWSGRHHRCRGQVSHRHRRVLALGGRG